MTQIITYEDAQGAQTRITVEAVELMELVGVWPRTAVRVTHGQHEGAPTFTVGDAYALMRDDAICSAQMERGKHAFQEWSEWFNSNDQWDLVTDRSACAAIVLGMDENTRHLWAAGGWNVLTPVQEWILGGDQ